MLIIGCDSHTRYQQIAMMDTETGELVERRLEHASGEARAFYARLPEPVLVEIEATGPIRWFERLLAELGHELWIGDSAKIRASEVRKQKTDKRDALLILDLTRSNACETLSEKNKSGHPEFPGPAASVSEEVVLTVAAPAAAPVAVPVAVLCRRGVSNSPKPRRELPRRSWC